MLHDSKEFEDNHVETSLVCVFYQMLSFFFYSFMCDLCYIKPKSACCPEGHSTFAKKCHFRYSFIQLKGSIQYNKMEFLKLRIISDLSLK